MDRGFASLVNESFGLRLSEARRLKRVSQAELGVRVGLSRGAVANLESGNQGVLLHHVFAFAKALDVEITELLPAPAELTSISANSSDEAFIELSRAKLSVILGGEDNEIT